MTSGASSSAGDAFFESLASSGNQPLLKSASGSIRFDLSGDNDTEHWFVSVDKGTVAVTHNNTDADAVVSVDKEMFDRMVNGQVNAMAAAIRGDLDAKGNLGLVMLFQRLFPAQRVES